MGKTFDNQNCIWYWNVIEENWKWAEMLSYVLWNSWIFPDVLDSTYACVLFFKHYVTLAGARCSSYAMYKSLNSSRFEVRIKCVHVWHSHFLCNFFLCHGARRVGIVHPVHNMASVMDAVQTAVSMNIPNWVITWWIRIWLW